MEDCCDNKNIIFTDYYVCTNCGVIQGYKYIHELTYYENENNLNKKFISKTFYKRIDYLSKKLYWITDKRIIVFLSEGLEAIKKHNNYNRIPFCKYVNPIYTVVSHIYTYDRAQNVLNFVQPLQNLIL